METTDQEDDDNASKKSVQIEVPPKAKNVIKQCEEIQSHQPDHHGESEAEEGGGGKMLQHRGSDDDNTQVGEPCDERGPMLLPQQSTEEETIEDICPEFFGVRSYLHHFYESMSVKNPQLYEDIYEEDLLYANHRSGKQHRQAAFCWRLFLFVGTFMLMLGIVFLLYGYLTPRRIVETGYHEDMEIIDRDAIDFNNNLNFCRVLGLAVFCSGGGLICATLLLPFISNLQYDDEDDCGGLGGSDDLESFRVVIDTENTTTPVSPTDKKIPATEELASIQPKRDGDEEMVMTNAGLCKAPALKKTIDQ